ncbi:MAG: hydrogenase nickel incorporation protein HypA [Sulfolobales archaeon]
MVHEWALAEAVVRHVIDIYSDKKIREIRIGLGELQNIDENILLFSLKELFKLNGLENVSIHVRKIPLTLLCRSCGFEWKPDISKLDEEITEMIHFIPEAVHSYIRCPRCNSGDFEIISGRGVYLEEVVVE